MTYSTKQVLKLIEEYQTNVRAIANLKKEYLGTVIGGNIAQYGIESTMPKAVGETSDPVYREFVRLTKQDKVIRKYENKVIYIQNRWDRVIDDTMETILHQRLSGVSCREIGNNLEMSTGKIHQKLNEIAEIMTD
ncbi:MULTISPECIES: hypothetical protein [Mammaliicoccus]|uniref:Uncharacterized protein n=1 Tax=Mammaliicoccus lentus TaxID=42858 RepID=A0ABS6GTA2_MAMLE|nr:hypothetical protein [Mammaliicoccus lentus]MBU6112532.1 hypothetical protein [Mammaliicoccus lentus]